MNEDPVFVYFRENIETVSKEELLEALRSALQSAHFWREACLLGLPVVQAGTGTGSFSNTERPTS